MGRARVLIDDEFVRQLLHIPSTLSVKGVTFDPMSRAVVVHLEGEQLPEVERGTESPVIWPRVHWRRERNDQGEWESRVEVEWDIPGIAAIGTVTRKDPDTQEPSQD